MQHPVHHLHGVGIEGKQAVYGGGECVKVLGRRVVDFGCAHQRLVGQRQCLVHGCTVGLGLAVQCGLQRGIGVGGNLQVSEHLCLQLQHALLQCQQGGAPFGWQRALGQKAAAYGAHHAQVFCQPGHVDQGGAYQVGGAGVGVQIQTEVSQKLLAQQQFAGNQLGVQLGALCRLQLFGRHSLL